MKLICPACGKRYENGKFCPECGTALVEEMVEMVCPICGTTVSSGKFCTECGAKLVEKGTYPAMGKASKNDQRDPRFGKYYDKKGCPRHLPAEEVQVALEELKPFVAQGIPEAQMLAGFIGLRSMDVPEVLELLKKADDGGNKFASYIRGLLTLEFGEIAEIGFDDAERRILEGYAELKDPDFATELARLYAYFDAKIDYSKAMKYALVGAEADQPESLRVLGFLYQKGFGVEPDVEKAAEYFKMAAAYGCSQAYSDLGYLFLGKDGHPQDYEQAFYWTNEAAKQGDLIGMFNLGSLYRDGIGVERDVEASAEWMKKAADLGYAEAMYQLGEYYSQALIIPEKAIEWYRKAAELGHELAIMKCTEQTMSASIENVKIERTMRSGKDGIAISADIVLSSPCEGKISVGLYQIWDHFRWNSLNDVAVEDFCSMLSLSDGVNTAFPVNSSYNVIKITSSQSAYKYISFIPIDCVFSIDINIDMDWHIAAFHDMKVIGDHKQRVHIESSKSFMSARKWIFYIKQ